MQLSHLAMFALLLPLSVFAQWTPPAQSAPKVPAGAAIRAVAVDPVGDNFNPGPDVIGLDASTDGAQLTMVLTFAGAILPPPGNGSGNEVVGIIDLDTDQNGATNGVNGGAVAQFCPSPVAGFGPDYELSFPNVTRAELKRLSDGALLGGFTVVYGPDRVTLTVPNALLGDDGIANIAAVIGNFATPTDCVPDGNSLTSSQGSGQSIPALSAGSLLLLALAAGVLGLGFMRRT